MRPIVIVNFKTYPSTGGEKAVELAKMCEAAASDVDMRIVVQATDINAVAQAVSIPVYAQHVDAIVPGKNTGFISPEAVRAAGAVGTLLNHSEHRITNLPESVERAKEAGLDVVICAQDEKEVAEVATLMPSFVAIEHKDLIGGELSISMADPELIERSVAATTIPVLAGAGVKTHKDLRIALEKGAKGVLLASGIAKASDPKEALRKLLSSPSD